eukprot:TRINITY_DN893_c0_g1_i1.p1 TRINITY_DN893_c0_g1~~TRINITY_DN893_c0_g1_i1.p1  ORF type:complete len:1078 (+),score=231.55 TRINITY_DN893_c0_g1_i1:88-3321(+)
MSSQGPGAGRLLSLKEQIAQAGDSDEETEDVPKMERFKRAVSEFDAKQSFLALKYKYGVFVDFTWREMRKRKVSYCLGTCSCFLVVFTVALLITTLANMPIVFLRLAEVENGERDLFVTPGSEMTNSRTLDYRIFSNSLAQLGDEYSYHSPRFELFTRAIYAAAPAQCTNITTETQPLNWAYTPPVNSNLNCSNFLSECVAQYCNGIEDTELHVIDTAREDRMGFGRDWGYGTLPPGNALVESGLARLLGLNKGDTILLVMNLAPQLVGLYNELGMSNDEWPYAEYKTAIVPVTIFDLISDVKGKLANNADRFIFMEQQGFLQHVSSYLHPDFPDDKRTAFAQADLTRFSSKISINMAPDTRRATYLESNYDTIQDSVVAWSADVLFQIGFNQVTAEAGVLEFMRTVRFFTLFLGLIISLVIVVLIALAIVLIYSLLMINVETRTFELGVLRMVGMQRSDLVQLVLTQAFLYALPAWALGLSIAFAIWLVLRSLMTSLLLVSLPVNLDAFAVGMATLVGLVMPLIASIAPIRHALGLNLQDSLDTNHSKVKAVTFTFERSEGSTVSIPVIVLGIALTLFGFLIYYAFPLALLTFNIQLLFYIFFGILLGMLFGLILLSLNFEHILEKTLTTVFFFWHNYAVRQLILKNLVSHRQRNRKTTLMYAASLGFIIWINVSWSLQIETVKYQQMQRLGGSMTIEGGRLPLNWRTAERVESVLSNTSTVEDWGYVGTRLEDYSGIDDEDLTSVGRYKEFPVRTKAVSPNLWGTVTDNSFMNVHESNGSHVSSLSNQLYTRWSTDRAVIGSLYWNQVSHDRLELEKEGFLFRMTVEDQGDDVEILTPARASAALDSAPVLGMSQFPARLVQDVAVSIPTYLALSSGKVKSVDEIEYWRLVVKLRDGWSENDVEAIDVAISKAMLPDLPSEAVSSKNLLTETASARTAGNILTLFFMVITMIAMTMCFFSLMASMYTNIYEQSKEIGILRSLGVSTFTTKQLYIYEAFVLVTAASIMGFFVGTLVAYTMVIQRQLFLQLPIAFQFPFQLFLFVVLLAFLFAIISSYGPATALLKLSVVSILRRTS